MNGFRILCAEYASKNGKMRDEEKKELYYVLLSRIVDETRTAFVVVSSVSGRSIYGKRGGGKRVDEWNWMFCEARM